jgi:hypothetical protein
MGNMVRLNKYGFQGGNFAQMTLHTLYITMPRARVCYWFFRMHSMTGVGAKCIAIGVFLCHNSNAS